uniref:Uncharacterized protein n=1 Tax=Scleropages formosus TaxID=113540 RepID=A0A8C9QR16_SCLFO
MALRHLSRLSDRVLVERQTAETGQRGWLWAVIVKVSEKILLTDYGGCLKHLAKHKLMQN